MVRNKISAIAHIQTRFMIRFKCLFVILLASQITSAQERLSLKEFLESFYDFSTLPAYLTETFSAQESSYDRTGNNNDGFNGTYSFVRRNADSSLVLFDVKGNGVVNRIWTPTPTDDSLDFYIDNDLTPTFTIRYRDLFTGNVSPFEAPLCANQLGGFYCYLPIPFNSSCKIVLRGKQPASPNRIRCPPRARLSGHQLVLDEAEKTKPEKIKSLWSIAGPQSPTV